MVGQMLVKRHQNFMPRAIRHISLVTNILCIGQGEIAPQNVMKLEKRLSDLARHNNAPSTTYLVLFRVQKISAEVTDRLGQSSLYLACF